MDVSALEAFGDDDVDVDDYMSDKFLASETSQTTKVPVLLMIRYLWLFIPRTVVNFLVHASVFREVSKLVSLVN